MNKYNKLSYTFTTCSTSITLWYQHLDAFAPQITAAVRVEFKKLNTICFYIPGGCIGFIQVLDIALNKILKTLVAQVASVTLPTVSAVSPVSRY
jgi:hypothetical protein